MATIKNHTDLGQSRKLAEILSLESADMHYNDWKYDFYDGFEHTGRYMAYLGTPKTICGKLDIHCWSLAALLGVLPFPQLSKDRLGGNKVGWMVSAYPYDCRYDSCWHDNPVDACYEMILKLYKFYDYL